MSAADLPQQRGASDLDAADQLLRGITHLFSAEVAGELAAMLAEPPAGELLPALTPLVVDLADPCTCPPSVICASSCQHCAGLPDDVPCPHDATPAGITVDVGEPVPALDDVDQDPPTVWGAVASPVCPHGHLAYCYTCAAAEQQPAAALEVSAGVDVGQVVDAVSETFAAVGERVDLVHAVAADQLAAAGVDVVVEWPAVQGQALHAVAAAAARPSTGHLPTLDWRGRHDVMSLAYGVREHLLTADQPLQLADVLLPVGPVLDQGGEGECVGMGVVDAANVLDELAGNLDGQLLGEDAASRLYRRAQQLDDRPGESYSGTSVLAGMKAGVEAGLWQRYLWAFGTRDIAATVLRRRPVVIGIPWLSGMYETAAGGRVDVVGEDTGAGHCLVIVGMRLTGPQGQPGPWFVWLNSWGTSYGDNGLGYVHHRDLARLLRSQGEAAVPLPVGAAD